jgi:hypothetical protein
MPFSPLFNGYRELQYRVKINYSTIKILGGMEG